MHKKQSKLIHNNFDNSGLATSFPSFREKTTIPKDLEEELQEIYENGYVILKNVLTQQEIQTLITELQPHLTKCGRNNFEGTKTNRVYNLLTKSQAFNSLAEHPRIMRILDNILRENYLLTAYQAIQILPGETIQPLHHDDQFINFPRPRRTVSIGTIWAITEFTKDNGATVVIPKSHQWGDELPASKDQLIPAEMQPGSVIVFLGTLWHGGGANTTESDKRLAISAQYCEPYIRPQENFMFSIPVEIAYNRLSPKLRSMVGYSIHPPFIGHVDGQHPLKHLKKLIEEKQNPHPHHSNL